MNNFTEFVLDMNEEGYEVLVTPMNEHTIKLRVTNIPKVDSKENVIRSERAISKELIEKANIDVMAEEGKFAYKELKKREEELF